MRRWMLAGNWKMHNTIAESVELAEHIAAATVGIDNGDIVVAPPFTALSKVCEAIAGSHVSLAAQNLFYEDKGAYTGEISPLMLTDAGVTYVIVGHSERRSYFHETDSMVNAKVAKALSAGLLPIMCVGETDEEREKDLTQHVIALQIIKGLYGIERLDKITLAYEPVWAIGTGKTASPQQAEAVHAFIRGVLAKRFNPEESQKARILYGGSVTLANIGQLISENDIDGALIGGASLKSESFIGIIKAVSGR
jgi:triosephosphate isomerase (TIM)